MKSRILIIIAICLTVIAIVGMGVNLMSENANQREIRLDQNSIERDSISLSNQGQKYEYSTLRCLALFHCDISSDTFHNCIDAKKDGISIEQLCRDSNIIMDDWCTTVEFPDGTWVSSCE